MSSFIDDHPNPDLLLKRNKLYLRHISKEIKKFGTDFVKQEKYPYYCGHINIFFKLVERLEPEFQYEKKYIKTFITSFIFIENPEGYDINDCSLFYQSLTNHIYAFKEYLKSDCDIQQWLPLWLQYSIDFENFRENDLKKFNKFMQKKTINENISIEENNQIDNNDNSSLMLNLQRKIKNIQDEHNFNKRPSFMDVQTVMKCKEFGQNIFWDKIKQDLKNSIQEWNYTWILLQEILTIFMDIIPENSEYKNRIEQELDMNKWKSYILNHENKEHAFKEYFGNIHETLELFGVSEHRNRYLILNQECNEIISSQSFEKAIPIIFQKIFKEFEILIVVNTQQRMKLKGKKNN